jgi:DNA replication protein DnaC
VAVARALNAILKQHENGIAIKKDKQIDFESFKNHSDTVAAQLAKNDTDIFSQYSCAFRCVRDKDQRFVSDILKDASGASEEYMAAKAFEIVMSGAKKALGKVPIVSYGNYLTADREEIERINAIKKLITAYRSSPKDTRPLSVAVFGPPGSGKSFAIKQLAEQLGINKRSIHTFNISQLQNIQDLHKAFHLVRDESVRGETPLIFWDEFDSDGFKWLKEFLAPMQDAEFNEGSLTHPFSKAIFVFAGGVCQTYGEFEKKSSEPELKEKKLPDFISRLRGYVNIKGPNKSQDETSDKNYEYLIRRAVLLRSVVERSSAKLIKKDGSAAINASVAQAFLRVDRFKHGARSLEALVTMSNLVDCSYFSPSCLPSDDLLTLHVDAKQFHDCLSRGTIEMPMIELIAEACHESWMSQKKEDGYEYGEKRSDDPPKRHPLLKPYKQLEDANKESNRITARLTQAKLDEQGLQIIPPATGKTGQMNLLNDMKIKDKLIEKEHEIWMLDHQLSGYEYADITNDDLRQHKCMKLYDDLSDEDKKLDAVIVDSLQKVLQENNYLLIKKEQK